MTPPLPSVSAPSAPAPRSRRLGVFLIALGLVWTSAFAVVDRFMLADPPVKEIAAPEPEYACPMKCGGGARHRQPGRCPVCGMALVRARGDKLAHADHTPKHGGQFFMARDQRHHLEGTLGAHGVLRIYLYDEFTLPLDPQGCAGEVTVQSTDSRGEPLGAPLMDSLRVDRSRSALVTQLPPSFALPCEVEAWLRFPGAREPELFNFSFKEMRNED